MDGELLKTILDAGVGVVAISIIAYLFHKNMQAHRSERKEWRESSDKQADKVSDALRDLAHSINVMRSNRKDDDAS